MATSREILERYTANAGPELAELGGRTLRFDIEGENNWLLAFKDNTVQLSESREPADTVVTCDESAFQNLAGNDLNLLTAWMRGEIMIEGDPWLAQKLSSVVRARAYNRSRGASA